MARFGSVFHAIAASLVATLLLQSSGTALAANATAGWDAMHAPAPNVPHAVSASPIPASAMRLTQHIRPVVIGQGIPGRPPVRTLREVHGAVAARMISRHASTAAGTLSVATSSANTTGMNHYWTYEEAPIPGLGTYMVNVANGNLIVQADDVDVPERGIDLAFQRVYNSNSRRGWTQNGSLSDGSPTPGQYGNGWTSSLDTHLALNSSGGITLFDVDGARVDFAPGTGNCLTPPAGQYAQLCWDGSAGYYWTKKDGTRYHYWTPDLTNLPVSQSAYAGRLAGIEARNRNNNISLTYTWINGDSSNSFNLQSIVATHSDGQTLTLNFGVVNRTSSASFKLLTSVVRPDGVTITYAYDQYNNLTAVSEPSNGSPNSTQDYGYYGSSSQMNWASGPRWTAGSWGQDGGYVEFGFSGAQVNFIGDVGIVNFTPNDGTNALLQPGLATGEQTFAHENFTYLSGETKLTDTDGHATNWFYDNAGRVTEMQQWTGAPNNLWLTSYQSWDSNDDLVASLDPRSSSASDPTYQTDFAYDGNGNTVAVAQPAASVSANGILETIHPTALYAYDANNNVVSYCDPQSNAVNGRNWSGTGTPPACPSTGGSGAARLTWTTQTYEPNGELTSMTTPLGYTRSISYAPAAQGGADYGLPTEVTSAGFAQQDGSTITPDQKFEYDSYGNLVCYSKLTDTSTRWYRLRYDGVNRVTAVADPDDASLSLTQCSNTGISGSHIVTTSAYYADGEIASTQTPSEYAAGASTAYNYDADDNVAKSTVYRMTSPTATPAPASTTYFYDGEDRLVEVQQPIDANYDLYTKPWTTRYLYDLSQNNTAATRPAFNGIVSLSAHGNLFKTQELLPPSNPLGVASPKPRSVANTTFLDINGNAFDALDRPTARYSLIMQTQTSAESLVQQTLTYDTSSHFSGSFAGELAETCNSASTQQCSWFNYNAPGDATQIHFNDGSSPDRSATYDPDGRASALASTAFGTQTYTYDADGRETTEHEVSGGGVTSPATFTHEYYADGTLKQLDVASSALTQSGLFAYSYRPDGHIKTLTINDAAQVNVGTTNVAFTYTAAGRTTQRSESGTGAFSGPMSWQYDSYGRLGRVNFPACSYCSGNQSSINPDLTLTWDPQGQLMATVASNSNQTFNYTMRGEAVQPQTLMANGVAVCATCSEGLNTQAGVISSGMTYDAAGRMSSMGGIHLTRAYDAEDHTISASTKYGSLTSGTSATMDGVLGLYQWGPSGNPVRIGSAVGSGSGAYSTIPSASSVTYDTLHWDSGQLIFVTNPSGKVDDIKVGASGDITPLDPSFTGLTTWDRGPGGTVMGCHNATAAEDLLTMSLYPSKYACGSGTVTLNGHTISFPSSMLWDPSQQLGGVLSTSIFVQIGVGQGKVMGMPRTDGIVDGFNAIQGVRTYDGSMEQWTTPDAFSGSTDDPASQKSYLWNGGNPLRYSDPTGYFSYVSAPPPVPDLNDTWFVPTPIFNPPHIVRSQLQTIASVVVHSRGPSCSSQGWVTAPKTGENYSEVWADGVKHRNDTPHAKAFAAYEAVGPYGWFDWQRSLFPRANYRQWRRASNVNVGIWAFGAGYTEGQMNNMIEAVLTAESRRGLIAQDEMLADAAYVKSQYLCHR